MFWEGKNLEIYGTVTKIKVFGVLQKHQKTMPKWSPKIDQNPWKMEPWAPKGRFSEFRNRFEETLEMRRFFDRSLAAQKSIKIAPWSVRGRIFRSGGSASRLRHGDSEAQGSWGRPNIKENRRFNEKNNVVGDLTRPGPMARRIFWSMLFPGAVYLPSKINTLWLKLLLFVDWFAYFFWSIWFLPPGATKSINKIQFVGGPPEWFWGSFGLPNL